MKLLHLLGDPADLGGILSVIRCLHEETTPLGDRHAVWVQTGYRETRRPALEYRHSAWVRAESSRHGELLARAIPAWIELRRLLRAEPFDLVHAHTRGAFPVAAWLAAVGRQPVVFTNHTYGRRTRLYRMATQLRRFHTVLLTPNMARHYALDPAAPRLAIIPDCCGDRFFSLPLKAPRRADETGAPIQLAGVGNIVRWKNWHLLIEALALLPPNERRHVQFVHYGEPPPDDDSPGYDRSLRERVRELGLEGTVQFRGPTLDVPGRLLDADWFVLPSTNEPCSVALSEAMALGLPALVSASGGNLDLVTPEKTGLLFAPDDPKALARNLQRIARGAAGMAAPGEIRRAAEPRRAARVAGLYRDLYSRLIAQKQ